CHGPGELHVASAHKLEKGEIDYTIVNPKHLEPTLREAVCQQCHLQGQMRVLSRGRDVWDFRPGLPLHLFYAVFFDAPGQEHYKAVGQVEQMYSSKCFKKSKGRRNAQDGLLGLACISCHDPHRMPEEKERLAFYRNGCLKCHQEERSRPPDDAHPATACNEALAKRQANQDNCWACHMPRMTNKDVAHTALTDHRILKRPKQPDEQLEGLELLFPGQAALVHFQQKLRDPTSPDYKRDLGMALASAARENPSRQRLAQLAVPLLNQAVKDHPDDVPAWEKR